MRRQIALLIAALLLTISVAVAAVLDQEVSTLTRGIEYPLASAALPERLPRLGVNADLLQYAPEELDAHLSRMRAAHITWVRQIVDWRETEPAPMVFQWSAWDALFTALAQHPDLSLVPVFYRTPRWASNPHIPDHPTLPPRDPTTFAAFVQAFVARYGHQIDYYQIWDEPNLYDAWGQTPPSAPHYAAMVASASAAIRAADPTAHVIAAALAPTTEDNQRNISDGSYLRKLYALGVSAHVDAFAGKPYGFNDSPLDRTVNHYRLNFSRVIALREIMLANGDSHKALWLSEWGWNALPSNWVGAPSIWGQVTQDQQVRYTLDALDRIEVEWPFVGGAILSEWQPGRPLDDPRWGFALVTPSGDASALLQALAARPQRLLPSNGFYPPTVPSATYSGLWTFGPLGADIGWLETSDSQLTFTFWGRDVGLLVRQGDFIAFLYPTLESFRPNATQEDSSGNAYVLLRSESQRPEVVPVPIATNLPLQAHTLRVVADRGWDQWVLVGYLVSDGDLTTPLHRLRHVAWAVVGVALVTLIGTTLAVQPALMTVQCGLMRVQRQLQRPIGWLVGVMASMLLTIGMLLSIADSVPAFIRRDATLYLAAIVLSGGLLALEPSAVLVIAACVALFVLFYARPIIGIALTLAYAPFFLFPVELFQFAFPISELLLLLTTAAALTKQAIGFARRRQIAVSQFPLLLGVRLQLFDVLAIAYAVLGAIALLTATHRGPALTEFRTLIVEPVLLYALMRVFVRRDQLHTLAHTLLISAAVVCVIGLMYFVTGSNVITAEEGARRLASVYGSPNNVALLLVRVVPLAGALALASSGRWRAIYAGSAALFIVTLVLTQSAGGLLLGLPTGLATIAFLQLGQRAWRPVVAVGFSVLVFAAVAAQVSPRFANVFDFTDGTNFLRLRLWESALAMIQDHPITGVGLDQFLERYRGTYVKPDAIWDSQLSHPHNLVLDVWLRLGIGGVIWLATLGLLVVMHGRRLLSQATLAPDERALLMGVLAALVGAAAHGLVDNSLFVVDLALIFWMFMALLAQMAQPPTPTEHSEA